MDRISHKILVIFAISILLFSISTPMFRPVSWAIAQSSSVAVYESPLSLKKDAITQLSISNGSPGDVLIFNGAKTSINNSVRNDYWDDSHLKNPLGFANDVLVIQLLQTSTAYKNGSNINHQAVISSISDIAQSDRGITNISISDASNASQRIKDSLTLTLMNRSISQAKKDQATAESYLQNQNMVQAVGYYGISWAEANVALLLADGKISPTVKITYPTNATYVNTQFINVSGTVDDVAAYSITNVTLTVNGHSLVIPLIGGTFSQQVKLQEGTNNIQITGKDLCTNKGTSSVQVILDTIKPTINITGVSDGHYYNISVQPVIKINDAKLGSSSITLDGAQYNGTPISNEGAHTLYIGAADLAGNTAYANMSFIIDHTPPVAKFYGILNKSFVSKTVFIDGSMTDANPGIVSLRIDGVQVSTSLPYYWNTSTYQDGIHIVEMDATDRALNTGSTSINLIVDNTPPAIWFTLPKNGSIIPSNIINLQWNGSDNYNISFSRLFLDNTPLGNTTDMNSTAENLPEGSHQASVEAHDLANNTATDTVNFTVDTISPSINISILEEGKYYNYNVTPQINVSDANLNFTSMTLNKVPYAGVPISDEGNYSLYVYAEDLADNSADKTVNFTIDKTPPALFVNELTLNPNILNTTYYINGTIESGAILTINDEPIDNDGTFVYMLDMSLGANDVVVNATDPAGNVATWNKTRLIDTDLLPDYYEINVLGTDPLNNDSDSSKTTVNEAGNGIQDDMEDFDNDGLINCMEFLYQTDPFKNDTDEDGLPDLFEIGLSHTSPISTDSDSNNVSDANEDPDHDGLTNLEEFMAGTDPLVKDSDMDSLSDGEEVHIYHISPVSQDSDEDRLTDDVEVSLGSDPNNPDSDRDGINDGNDTFAQSFYNATVGAEIEISGSGNLQNTLTIQEDKSPYSPLTTLSGLASDFVNINTTSSFQSANVQIYYNKSGLDGLNESNLKLYYFDEATNTPVEAPNQIINISSGFVEATTNHLSEWFVADDTQWAAQSLITGSQTNVILNDGDRINVTVQVHNSANVNVTDDVLVYFYEGDPDTNGIYIGNATITGGILANSSKAAILKNYKINSTSADIYVLVDPLDNIKELNESNNKAYKALNLSSDNIDSDGDGLTDAEEMGGMRVQYPYPVIHTDPYDEDTDQDGLNDSVEMGVIAYDSYGPYHKMVSYPNDDDGDSDNDGVSDYAEVTGHDIYVANTHDSALAVENALSEADAFKCLNKVHVTSDPLNKYTDKDAFDDGEELRMGTDPSNLDTDGDGIRDDFEANIGEEPTIFDISPPTVSSNLNPYSKDPNSLFAEYHFIYMVKDLGGVKQVDLVKQGKTWDDFTSTGRDQTYVYRDIDFTNGDVLLNSLMTTSVYINSEDWNGNSGSYLAWRQYSAFARAAATITTGTITDEASATALGGFAGMTASVGQFSELGTEAWNDPSIIPGTVAMVAVLSINKEAQAVFLASLPIAIDQMEEMENPYSKDTYPVLHDRYATAWKLSYVGSNLALFFAGSEALSTAKTSTQLGAIFQDSSILNKIQKSMPYFEESGSFGVEGEMKASLAEGAVSSGLADSEAADIIAQETTMSKRIEAVEYMDKLTPEERTLMDNHLSEVDEILKDMTPADAASLVADPTFQDIIALKNLQGVSPEKIVKMKGNLVKAYHEGTITKDQAENYISIFKELGTHNNVIGLENAVDKMASANLDSNFYGWGNEDETALEYAKILGSKVEFTPGDNSVNALYDLKVTYPDGKIEYIECKKASPTGVLNSNKLERMIGSAQNKFSNPALDTSNGKTVLDINAKEGTIDIDVNDINNLIKDDINPAMDHVLDNLNKKKGIPKINRIDEIRITLQDRVITVVKDGNSFKMA